MASDGNKPIETLRLSSSEKQKLVDYVEQQAKKPIESCRRALRVGFNGRNVLTKVTSAEGQTTVCSVVPRNLSRRGLAYVHGRFVYPDSPCEVTLPMLSGKWCVLKGVIRRCRHVHGIVHEVSVVFDETIDLNQFVRLTTEHAEAHLAEMTEDGLGDEDASNTSGRVLIVDDLVADRRLFSMWMRKLDFEIKEAGDIDSVVQLLNQHKYDLFIIDANLGEEDGVELIKHLRGQGVVSPVISISATDTEDYRKRATEAGATEILAKPFTLDDLKTCAYKVMSIDSDQTTDDSPLYSDMNNDVDMAPLVTDFVKGLAVYVAKLRSANVDADFESLSRLAVNLKGAGGSHGFQPMTDAAETIVASLEEQEHDLGKIRGGVNNLLHIIRRVQAAYDE